MNRGLGRMAHKQLQGSWQGTSRQTGPVTAPQGGWVWRVEVTSSEKRVRGCRIAWHLSSLKAAGKALADKAPQGG
jgi:hypothetical protein